MDNRLLQIKEQLDWQSRMTSEFYSGMDDQVQDFSPAENLEPLSASAPEQQRQIGSALI